MLFIQLEYKFWWTRFHVYDIDHIIRWFSWGSRKRWNACCLLWRPFSYRVYSRRRKLIIYWFTLVIYWWSVRLGAAATAFLHKLQKGIPPGVPLKGHEEKSYKQLQEEAIESKRRDLVVLKANYGIWPGVRIPSHALFLWASGSEMTTLLESDHMPNKYISKDLRYGFS